MGIQVVFSVANLPLLFLLTFLSALALAGCLIGRGVGLLRCLSAALVTVVSAPLVAIGIYVVTVVSGAVLVAAVTPAPSQQQTQRGPERPA